MTTTGPGAGKGPPATAGTVPPRPRDGSADDLSAATERRVRRVPRPRTGTEPPQALRGTGREERLRRWIPRGHRLSEDRWRRRHRDVVVLLALHAPFLAAIALWRDQDATVVLLAATVPLALALLALPAPPGPAGRQVRAAVAAGGLMTCAALLVYIADGAPEAHFHFFVLLPVLALYEDWVPFLTGIGFVLVEHGVVGAMWPDTFYASHSAHSAPWTTAAIHAAFVAAASLATIVQWRVGEVARTAEQHLSRELAHRSRHDDLTGLTNRTALLEDATRLLEEAESHGEPIAVLVLDLDRFKDVNDTLGHDHGDALLAHVGRCLRRRLRSMDQIARLGGDEFAVVLPGADEVQAQAVARRLRAALLEDHATLAGIEVPVDASIGIAVGPIDPPEAGDTLPGGGAERERDGEDPRARYAAALGLLLRQAEVAMYTAKNDRSGVAVYDPGQDGNTRSRLALLTDLRRAVEADAGTGSSADAGLLLHYQPAVRLDGERPVAAEALVRWRHPRHGLVPPMEFIPLAEATNLIVPLTHQVLHLALAQIGRWSAAGLQIPVAVNVSPRSLTEGDLPALVRRALAEHGVPPHLLRLEVTETSLAGDPARAMRVLKDLHDHGVGISIDDFGTGYSSLSYLKHLPADELKIDRSFVAGLLTAPEDRVLVRATIDLGHNLGMSVVAEGVEDAETAAELRDLGCDLAQGYHYARPMPAEEFERWVREHGAAEG